MAAKLEKQRVVEEADWIAQNQRACNQLVALLRLLPDRQQGAMVWRAAGALLGYAK